MISHGEVVVVVVKQLSHHEMGSLVNFVGQVLPILMLTPGLGDVAFRESGRADAQVADLFQVGHEFRGITEPSFGWHPLAGTAGRVSAQR